MSRNRDALERSMSETVTAKLNNREPSRDAFNESDHPRDGGKFTSGGGGGSGGGGEKRTPVKWPTESEIAGRKRQQEVDKERAILNAGGLPPGWTMNGGRKIPPRDRR